ncbi:MAG: riboflavin synthase [Chloroflexia bacterium]
MFTGLIEEIGTVRRVTGGPTPRLTVEAEAVLEGTRPGDSIAVNGVCLTVVALDGRSFQVDVMPETLRRSNLGRLQPGHPVNLERALSPSGRLGGHLVQGHVDGMGRILEKRPEGEALWVTIAAPPEVMRYLVPRAFIALDGASLTVARVEGERFSVSLVPFTQAHITLPRQPVGYAVNLEVDIVAKYVERLLTGREEGRVDWERLAREGWESVDR